MSATVHAPAGYSGTVRFGRGVGLLFLFWATAFAASPPASITPQDVLTHLEQVIAWYRDINTLAPPAVDVLISDDLHATALQALQLTFTFARAEAALLGEGKGAPSAASGSLQQAAATAADRVAGVQAQIAKIDAEIPKSFGKQRTILQAQRNELNAALELAKEIQTTVQNLVSFTGTISSDGGTLSAQIGNLERSVPQVQGKTASAPENQKNAASAAPFSPETAGVMALATELFNNQSNRSHLNDLLSSTQNLLTGINTLKGPLIAQARASTQQSDQITSQLNGQDPAQLAAAQKQLSDLATRFKQFSTAIVPLGEEGIAVGTAQNYLQESITTVDQESSRTGRYLLVKAVTLGVVIFIVLFVGELWRRATFRYVHDARRRRQFLLLRRVVIAVAVVLAIVFWFVSELGSLATYAGFVTAGVAVALQSPILSVVAYFFLIGRYGLRVGDRVTISGVTGDVIEIGLVRIYLSELAGTGPDLHPTGRVVVFSNSVIFQPSALYKQMPGIDYVWHTAVLTLASDSDFQLAENTLNAAVDAFFEQYRADIEQQYRSLEQSVDMHIKPPKPETRLRFTDSGLQYLVRYPAEIPRAAEMDNEILRALHDAVEKEAKLKFAEGGTPKVQA